MVEIKFSMQKQLKYVCDLKMSRFSKYFHYRCNKPKISDHKQTKITLFDAYILAEYSTRSKNDKSRILYNDHKISSSYQNHRCISDISDKPTAFWEKAYEPIMDAMYEE